MRGFFAGDMFYMPMFHFRFEAEPKRTNPDFGRYAGAMICCWVQRKSQDEAAAVARGWIGDEDWRITTMEYASLITKETQLPEGMRYFEQAEIDGEVFVFITHPTGAKDDDAHAS
jgi:hypothetical protein